MGEIFKSLVEAKESLDAQIEQFDKDIAANIERRDEKTLTFPKVAVTPKVSDLDEYNFKWQREKTYTFTSAFYSHVRATLSSGKKHDEKALRKTISAGLGGKKDFERFDRRVREQAKAELARKYQEKFEAAKQRDVFRNVYKKKFSLKDDDLSSSEVFGLAVAKKILGSSDFRYKLTPIMKEHWRKMAGEVITATHGAHDDDPYYIRNKIARDISASITSKSVTIPYTVKYHVLKIDVEEAQRRLDRTYGELRKRQEKELRLIVKNLRDFEDELRMAKAADLDRWGGNMRPWSEETTGWMNKVSGQKEKMNKVEKRFKSDRENVDSEAVKVRGWIATRRTIGSFYIAPVAEAGDLEQRVAYRNTQAQMTVEILPAMDPSRVSVGIEYLETASNKIPKLVPFSESLSAALSQRYPLMGDLTFDINGEIAEATGKIGERFVELCQRKVDVAK